MEEGYYEAWKEGVEAMEEEGEEYYEAYTVVEGALDSEGVFSTEEDALAFLERECSACRREKVAMEGYILPHYHGEDYDGECVCSQYLTDHHPVVAYDPDGDGAEE